MVKVTLFTREDCKLCDQVAEDLKSLQEQIPHQLVKIDIESDPALNQKYKEIIPVVEIGPYTLKAPITAQDLQISLRAARDGQYGTKQIEDQKTSVAVRLNRYVLSFARHWLVFINLFIFLYIGLPGAAPLLVKAGAIGPATVIYKIYTPMCHQLAYRSWFLFGEQPAYPIEAANVSTISYEEATGLNPNDLEAARDFIGNERLGYKIGLCQRDIAIYAGIFLFGLIFAILRKRMKPLPMLAWFLIGIVPIALDGGSQLLSSLSLFSFLSWESTPFLRTLTGSLFGVMNAWLAYPYIEESMIETQALLSAKLAGVVE
ncbi:MAG: hypothetical protein A2Z14_09200 [Chloroflexi bacterium RBG_16_48_8]|nr:MAG: hypothetical protein A2Z14_09200 [Chloroflexi bacterium RBG_16_48_8]